MLMLGVQGPRAGSAAPRKLTRPALSQNSPAEVFDVVQREGKFLPGAPFAYQAGPLPTNAWFQNFASAEEGDEKGKIFQMPYITMAHDFGLHVSQPEMDEGQTQVYEQTSGVSVGMAETEIADGPYAADWDELSFTLGWRSAVSGWIMQAPLVRGSPYVTAEFNGATPRISSLQQLRQHNGQAWISVDGVHNPCDGYTELSGRVFAVDLLEHDKTWLIFAPTNNGEQGSLKWVCKAQPFSLTATSQHTGAIRVALANDCTTGAHPAHCQGAPNGKDASQYARLLVEHAGAYPRGGKIEFSVDGDRGTMTWTWDIWYMVGFQKTKIVQLAWPVHKPLLYSASDPEKEVHASTPFKDVRGPTVAVVGDVWDLHYDLMPDIGFRAQRSIDPAMKQELLETLAGPQSGRWQSGLPDKDFQLLKKFQLGMGDTYFSGKLFGRLARLVPIADELGQSQESWFQEMVQRLTSAMEAWLKKESSTPFLYDLSWGGLVSCGCEVEDCDGMCEPTCKVGHDPADPQTCPGLNDPLGNFGNSVYNDHHFHYGYWVYAAAVLAKYNPTWEEKWREQLLALVRDYANPSEEDRSFPVVRHKDWFLGFSWASGPYFVYAKGRNQESTSEAVNAYYAVYTYGKALEDRQVEWARDLKDLGRIWTAMEAHGAETYWQVRDGSEVYNSADFPDHVIGILWEHSATHTIWFGKHDYQVSGIQLLPFTPASETYLKPDWVNQHFQEFQRDCQTDTMCSEGWSWTVCLEQAVVDKQGALGCINAVPEDYFDPDNDASGGNSMTNSLYWIATRPELDSSMIKQTSMPLASELPALSEPVDEGQYAQPVPGQVGEQSGLNAGIAQGLATHNMIAQYSSRSEPVYEAPAWRLLSSAFAGLALLASAAFFAYRASRGVGATCVDERTLFAGASSRVWSRAVTPEMLEEPARSQYFSMKASSAGAEIQEATGLNDETA